MCGRYAMAVSPDELPRYFGQDDLTIARYENTSQYDSQYCHNIGPTRVSPILIQKDNEYIVQYLKWGLIPHWTKTKQEIQPWKRFNAKVESLDNSPLWRSSWKSKRCLVPVQGYYEWERVGSGSRMDKVPYYVRDKQDRLVYLAGLWDDCELDGEVVYSFTIVTEPAPDSIRWLHPRLPVVLTPNTKVFKDWLDQSIESPHLKHCPYGDLQWYKVSKDIGKMSSYGAQLTIKLTQPEQRGQKRSIVDMLVSGKKRHSG